MERFKLDPAFQEFGGLRYLADLVDRAPRRPTPPTTPAWSMTWPCAAT